MPGAGFKRLADETRGSVIAVHKEPYALVEHAMVSERDRDGESSRKLSLYLFFVRQQATISLLWSGPLLKSIVAEICLRKRSLIFRMLLRSVFWVTFFYHT